MPRRKTIGGRLLVEKDKALTLLVDQESIEAFVICLALGTLQAMLDDVLQEEAGIWTLGRPGF